MRKIYISKNIINCTKTTYDFKKFWVKGGANQIHSCAPQAKGIHQGCGISLYLPNTFTNNITGSIDMEETYSLVING